MYFESSRDFEDRLDDLINHRRWLVATARQYFETPNVASRTRLEVARVIASVSFGEVLTKISLADKSAEARLEEMAMYVSAEDQARVASFNEIVGQEIFGLADEADLDEFLASDLSDDDLASLAINFTRVNHCNGGIDLVKLMAQRTIPGIPVPDMLVADQQIILN